MSDADRRVNPAALLGLTTAIFGRCGMTETDAALLADTLVAADRRGVHSHGVLRVPEYVQKLTIGGVAPRGTPHIARDSGACLVVDGGNSMGQIGAHFAMRHAIERAATTGIAAAAVRGSNHCGALAYFTMLALPHDMIGLATTNALPTMAPWGGAERLLGINPLAIAIPAGREFPIVYDAAFSGAAHGKIRVYRQKGLPIPEGWALDHEGRPTTEPAAALAGLLLPSGGFKGVGMAMVMGILSSMLSGAAYGSELGDMERGARAGQDGHFFLALRVGAFEAPDRFKARVDAAIAEIHTARRAPGVDRLYVPGEREFLMEAAYGRDGIPLAAETIVGVIEAAERLGLPADLAQASG